MTRYRKGLISTAELDSRARPHSPEWGLIFPSPISAITLARSQSRSSSHSFEGSLMRPPFRGISQRFEIHISIAPSQRQPDQVIGKMRVLG